MKRRAVIATVTLCLAGFACAAPADTAEQVLPSVLARDILQLYKSVTQLEVVGNGTSLGRMTLSVAEPVSRGEAITLIERTLFLNGLGIVQMGPDTVMVGTGESIKEHIPRVTEEAQLPTAERVVSLLVRFAHSDADEAARLFTQHISPAKHYSSAVRADEPNALWLTERTSVLRAFLAVAKIFDVPPAARREPFARPSGMDASSRAGVAAPDSSTEPVTIRFPDSDVRDMLPLYEALTGFKIIRDNLFQGKVDLSVAEPVSREKAIEIIEQTFFQKGLSIIQVAPDMVEVLGPRNARSQGIPTLTDPDEIPKRERVISFLLKIDHAQANDVATQLMRTTPFREIKSYTSILTIEPVNAIWLTDRASAIRRKIEFARSLDVPAEKP